MDNTSESQLPLPPPFPQPTESAQAAPSTFLRRFALIFKLCGIGIILLLLQIPLLMVDGLLRERLGRRDDAIADITSSWGSAQTILGPILVVPYTVTETVEKQTLVNGTYITTTEEKLRDRFAYFLPAELRINGDLEPSQRHRGIYDATVYTARLQLSGRFTALDLKTLNLAATQLQWDRAWLAVSISDLRGTRETVELHWGEHTVAFLPGTRVENLGPGLHAPLPRLDLAKDPVAFDLKISLNGSYALSLTPLGALTRAQLQSPWPDPSFTGNYLPVNRDLRANGFEANWEMSYYGRDYAQQFTNATPQPFLDETKTLAALRASTFGVSLCPPIDTYRSVERATKYGALFLILIFTAFFLFEILSKLRLHSLHYLLVGAALVLFYLGLLALSEFLPIGRAYLAASAASTALVGLYCRAILRSNRRALVITGTLGGIYGYLYFVLQMQDYSLLAGTAALFLVLAVVMFTTRRVDWASSSSSTNS